MSESEPTPTAPSADTAPVVPAEPKAVAGASRRTYILVFVALAVITAIEIGISYLPVPRAPILVPLALVKAGLVALFYMHLKYDRRIFAFVFVAGLLMGIGLILALLALFSPAGHGAG
jgi:cytochrome c oxidase subunit IV